MAPRRRSRYEILDPHLPEELRMEAIRAIPGSPTSQKGTKGKVRPSSEYLDRIRRRKIAILALPEEIRALAPASEHANGGRPRTRYTRAEIEEDAMKRMLPRALEVLSEQLDHPDAKVRQAAAVKVVEYVKGKPTQTSVLAVDQVSKIVYESAAWRPELSLVIDQEPRELEAGDPPDDVA